MSRLVFTVVLILAILIGLVGSLVINILYGVQYKPSYLALIFILPGVVIFSITNILASYFAGIGKLKFNFYSLVSFIFALILYLILIPRYSILGAVDCQYNFIFNWYACHYFSFFSASKSAHFRCDNSKEKMIFH